MFLFVCVFVNIAFEFLLYLIHTHIKFLCFKDPLGESSSWVMFSFRLNTFFKFYFEVDHFESLY